MNRTHIFAAIAAMLVVSASGLCFAQTKSDISISGHVIDAGSGEHLPFITILLKGTNIGTQTFSSGHFIMRNLPEGTFEVVASSIGYKDASIFLELKKEYNLPPLSINLAKHIPIEAGLGGGSSDCAHMMKLLNEFFSLGLSDEDMEKKVSRFGADCAFFIRNKPVFAEGLGDTFSQIDISLKDYFIVLVKPDISISTRQAFSAIIPHNPNNDLKNILSTEPISQWKYKISNIFERSIFPLFPNLQVIKETLYDIGAIYASMSGSGSTIYGIFDRPIENLCSIFPDCFTYSHRLS